VVRLPPARIRISKQRLALGHAAALAALLLAACGESPEPAPPPVAALDLQTAAALDFVVSSTIRFTGADAAPHRLRVSYQGADLCRWELKRLDDADADRLIEYRSHTRAFVLPQDAVESLEYGPDETRLVFARMALRHLVLIDGPDETPWAERALEDGLGLVRREFPADGRIVYRHFDAAGELGEVLSVLSRFEARRPGGEALRLML